MKVIYKYVLSLDQGGVQELDLPVDYEILSVQNQNGEIAMWVSLTPGWPVTSVRFHIIGTGHHFDPFGLKYLSTVQVGMFVWHVYQEMSVSREPKYG